MTKLNIRLPDDDRFEPNPYDSKNSPKDLLKNRWLWDWKWWVGILTFAGGIVVAGIINGRIPL
jgi:hypothetical protein